jgi:hypothetical protein
MSILPDIFSHRIDHGNGSHTDVLLNQEPEGQPDQYASLSWNPVMHPRGGPGNPGQFTRKIGVDPDMVSSPEPGGPGMESDEPQIPVAPPLPPARAAVATTRSKNSPRTSPTTCSMGTAAPKTPTSRSKFCQTTIRVKLPLCFKTKPHFALYSDR